MKKSDRSVNALKYQLQKKLDEVRVAIISGANEKLPQLFIELEYEQKKFEEVYVIRKRFYHVFKHYVLSRSPDNR